MNPEEKSKELVEKMYKVHSNSASQITMYFAKQCALIAVDEIIKAAPTGHFKTEHIRLYSEMIDESIEFWQEVKQEIEKL